MSETGNNGRESAESFSRELATLCASDSLSEEGLRELFERHGLISYHCLLLRGYYAAVNNYDFFVSACSNKRVDEGVIFCLLEYFPLAASATTKARRNTPLHFACFNKSATRGIIQLLIVAAPDSVRSVNNTGKMPLHALCFNEGASEVTLIEVLKILIMKCPEAVRHADIEGRLPIHIAAARKSPDFCRLLIEAYPGSERISDSNGSLLLHCACWKNTAAAVEYLYKLYPDAINHASTDGFYPIHKSIKGVVKRADLEGAIEIMQYLLNCDPNVKLQIQRMSLLHFSCLCGFNDSNVNAALEAIKVVYDAHPEAIEEKRIASKIQSYHLQVQAFINSELVYARQARNLRLMNTPDGNGRLPLHRALQDNVRLGSIKLLVKGNPSAARNIDDSGALPLHIACQHHDSACVVGYMISLAGITLDTTDRQGNTALHYACRGAKYDTISLLLDEFDAVSVSKRNAQKKLPIDLLWESSVVEDRESVEYTGCVFRLLKAYPETVMAFRTDVQSASGAYLGQHHSGTGKKRKLGNE